MRDEIIRLIRLGSFPPSKASGVAVVKPFQTILESIKMPVTDARALELVKIFGRDDLFSLEGKVIDRTESAPDWLLEMALQNIDNEWIRLLNERVENAQRAPRSQNPQDNEVQIIS